MNPVELHQGEGPVILAMPHTGMYLPESVLDSLNETGQALSDSDWNIHKLYADLLPDVTTVRATFHRYVIDANRSPSDESLYPGQNTTGLCPLTDFEGRSLYKNGSEPDETEIEQRRLAFHAPYHAAIKSEIERVRSHYGFAILYDCHSIRSRLPFLFDGLLPDFNIGTNNGTSCSPIVEQLVYEHCLQAIDYSTVLNGRFKGGWTTRHYGCPNQHVHAIQMELTQSAYMQETPPWKFLPQQAERVRLHLRIILEALNTLALSNSLNQ